MSKKKKHKGMKFVKFVVCPNCKRPLYRKSALKVKGLGKGKNYCGHCAMDIAGIVKGTPAGYF